MIFTINGCGNSCKQRRFDQYSINILDMLRDRT